MCMSSYQECGPVKDVKPLKGRTKRERMYLAMREKLPELTEAQKKWIYDKVFEKYGYYWKGGDIRCMCCGHYDHAPKPELAVSLEVDSHTCPNCGNNLHLRFWKDCNNKRYGGYEDVRDVSFVTTFKGHTVIRTYQITRWVPVGGTTRILINEVYQNWIDDDGRETILSKAYTRSPYHFRWSHDDWGVKRHNAHCSGYFEMSDVFDVIGNLFYPIARVSPLLKRNGWNSSLLKLAGRVNLAEVMKKMLTDPLAEEMVKTGQNHLLCYWVNEGGPNKDRMRWLHALRICNRNGYYIQDASMWVDYLDLLQYFHKDTHNAFYVCPADLKKEHDRLYTKKERIENAKELARRVAQAEKYEKQYKKHRGMFFGICFGNKDIVITVIGSVKEMAEEGTMMHHCVYANAYYDHERHPNSLILSAKDKKGNRLETIEVNTKTWKIIQSRGLQNHPTAQHEQIVRLMEENMYRPKKVA